MLGRGATRSLASKSRLLAIATESVADRVPVGALADDRPVVAGADVTILPYDSIPMAGARRDPREEGRRFLTAEEVLLAAQSDRRLADLLDVVWENRLFANVLFAHREDLLIVPRVQDPDLPFEAPGLLGVPYVSRHAWKMPKGRAHPLEEVARDAQLERERASAVVTSFHVGLDRTLRDDIVAAVLNTVRANAALKGLVASAVPIDRGALGAAVKDYSGLDWSPIGTFFEEALGKLFSRDATRRPLQGMTANLDALLGSVDGDSTYRHVILSSAVGVLQAMRLRGVGEHHFRAIVTSLARVGLLEWASPIYGWCRRCQPPPDFRVRRIAPDLLPPLCPACGHRAEGVGMFRPVHPFIDAIMLTDGFLGAAVGWALKKRGVLFAPEKGISATECDFVVGPPDDTTIIECKMHSAAMAADAARRAFLKDRGQLRDHIGAAKSVGRTVARAVCVVNWSRSAVRKLTRSVPLETEPDFLRANAAVMSYEDFPEWVDAHLVAPRPTRRERRRRAGKRRR